MRELFDKIRELMGITVSIISFEVILVLALKLYLWLVELVLFT